MRRSDLIFLWGLVISLMGSMGAKALAAEKETKGAVDSATFEASLEGLTPEEQEAMREAYQEIAVGQGATRGELAGAGTANERLGNSPFNANTNLGQTNPGAAGLTGGEVTGGLTGGQSGGMGLEGGAISPGQKDDAVLKGLSERGVPGMERASGLEHRGGELGHSELGREGVGGTSEQSRGGSSREQGGSRGGEMERGGSSREQAEHSRGESEHGGREHAGRELERPTSENSSRESERPSMEMEERPTMERPTAEQPTREYERPTSEPGGSAVH